MTDLFSNQTVVPLTHDGLRLLAEAGTGRDEEASGFSYRVHRLSARLGDDVVTEVVRRYGAGESATTLAKELGVAPSALLRLMREQNVVVRRHGVPDELAATMTTKHKAGATIAELEERHGLSHGAVLPALKAANATMRPTGRRPMSGFGPVPWV